MTPLLSIVIPGFNRPEPLKYTLRSAAAAACKAPGPVEIILVDDGSTPSLTVQLAGFDPGHPVIHIVQANQGSIAARMTGLNASTGQYVHFLDSDDLVHPDKYRTLLPLLLRTGADIAYDDLASATLGPDYSVAAFAPQPPAPAETDTSRFFLALQPAPHAPVYRREYLRDHLARPLVAARRAMDSAGDVWLYYNLAASTARIVKAPTAHTAPGPHDEERYSLCWERLAAAALLVMEAFAASCPRTPGTLAVRTTAGEAAFNSWRRLPRGYHAGFSRRTLALWKQSPRGPLHRLGGHGFTRLARFAGPLAAARLLRLFQARPYPEVRTLHPADGVLFFRELDNHPAP